MSTRVIAHPWCALFTAFGLAAAIAAPASAQMSSRENALSLDVLAVDKDGHAVSDLVAADFELREKGKRQTIIDVQYVAPAAQPRTTVFVIDDLALSFDSVHQVRRAISAFVDGRMESRDLVAILRTGADGSHRLTADKKLLHDSLQKIQYNSFERGGASSGPGVRRTWSALSSLRSLETVVSSAGAVDGRKSLVLFSDGLPALAGAFGDPSVLAAFEDVVRAANRHSVVIYAVDARGLSARGSRGFYQYWQHSGLERLAEETGGAFVRNTDVGRALQRVMASETGHYVVWYRSEITKPGRAHSVDVRVKRRGVTARARREVFVPLPRDGQLI